MLFSALIFEGRMKKFIGIALLVITLVSCISFERDNRFDKNGVNYDPSPRADHLLVMKEVMGDAIVYTYERIDFEDMWNGVVFVALAIGDLVEWSVALHNSLNTVPVTVDNDSNTVSMIALKYGLPDVDIPDVDLPDVDIPDVDIPDVDLPDIDKPDIDLPDVDSIDWDKLTDIDEIKGYDLIPDVEYPEMPNIKVYKLLKGLEHIDFESFRAPLDSALDVIDAAVKLMDFDEIYTMSSLMDSIVKKGVQGCHTELITQVTSYRQNFIIPEDSILLWVQSDSAVATQAFKAEYNDTISAGAATCQERTFAELDVEHYFRAFNDTYTWVQAAFNKLQARYSGVTMGDFPFTYTQFTTYIHAVSIEQLWQTLEAQEKALNSSESGQFTDDTQTTYRKYRDMYSAQ